MFQRSCIQIRPNISTHSFCLISALADADLSASLIPHSITADGGVQRSQRSTPLPTNGCQQCRMGAAGNDRRRLCLRIALADRFIIVESLYIEQRVQHSVKGRNSGESFEDVEQPRKQHKNSAKRSKEIRRKQRNHRCHVLRL